MNIGHIDLKFKKITIVCYMVANGDNTQCCKIMTWMTVLLEKKNKKTFMTILPQTDFVTVLH